MRFTPFHVASVDAVAIDTKHTGAYSSMGMGSRPQVNTLPCETYEIGLKGPLLLASSNQHDSQ